MERLKYLEKYLEEVKILKKKLSKFLNDYEVILFGSIVRGDFSPGLSDVDVAIVSEEFDNRKKFEEVYDFLWEEYFHAPFEFHLLTKKKWEFYRRFVTEFIRV